MWETAIGKKLWEVKDLAMSDKQKKQILNDTKRFAQMVARKDSGGGYWQVKVDNTTAISCYAKLGFERVAAYEEYFLELKQTASAIPIQTTGLSV